MMKDLRSALLIVALPVLSGCNMAPAWQMRQAQLRTYQMYRQNQALQAQASQSQQMAAQMQQELGIANERLTNLNAERSMLHQQYQSMLAGLPAPGGLSESMKAQLADLASRYSQFDFDPVAGVVRFNGDLLFASGSDVIQPDGKKVLRELAQIVNSPDASQFQILVVGHTDDRPVVQPATMAKHETNWELSAHRATRVVRAMAAEGVSEPRMGIAGYNKFQPAASNGDESSRKYNRRVEIFLLPPDTSIAGREVPRQ